MTRRLRFGSDFPAHPSLSSLERIYVRLFGIPVLGLRIRAHWVTPILHSVASEAGPRIHDILDVGCGRGAFSCYLARLFPAARITGMDLDVQLIRDASRMAELRGLSNLQFVQRDITREREEGTRDLILATDFLEHIEDDAGVCRRLHTILRPGGWLVLHVPHLTRNRFGWRRQNFMGIEGHVRPGYRREELRERLESAGFGIWKLCYTYGWFETLANDLSYAITKGREQNRTGYALAFPWLLLLSRLGRWPAPAGDGSGLLAVAVKRAEAPRA
jgi:2-polyprenyl-3-methyl-5-hydroxy-6-metoxy-1,4-benzoquinol methylase